MTSQTAPRVLVGHGTENDFVVLPDPDGTVWPEHRLDAAMVRRLCERRAGRGGDGVLRVLVVAQLRVSQSEQPHARPLHQLRQRLPIPVSRLPRQLALVPFRSHHRA